MTVFQLYAMAPANFSVSLLIHGLYSKKTARLKRLSIVRSCSHTNVIRLFNIKLMFQFWINLIIQLVFCYVKQQ